LLKNYIGLNQLVHKHFFTTIAFEL
jgi:hypothetical protein